MIQAEYTKIRSISSYDLSRGATEYILEHNATIGVDIETDGLQYRDCKVGAITVYIPHYGVELIHVRGVAGRLLPNFNSVCADMCVTKVLQNAQFDMRFLEYHYAILFKNVACTYLGANLIDPKRVFKHNLVTLLQEFLGVTIAKDQALSNWFAETLTPDQIRYAIQDVVYLPALYEVQLGYLRAMDKYKQFRDVCDYLPTKCHLELEGIENIYERR